MKKTLIKNGAACAALTVSLFAFSASAAATIYPKGSSGSWDDGANFSSGVAPGSLDMFWYTTSRFSPPGDRAVTLTLDGKEHYLTRFYADGGTAGVADPSPLTVQGPGTLYVLGNNGTYNQLQNGREITFDHINFVLTNHLNVSTSGGGLYAYGKLTVKGGHVEALYDNANITVSSTGSLIIDEGADVCTRLFGVDASSTLDIRNGTFLFTGCSVNDVVTPNLHIGANSKLLSVGTTARYWTRGIIPAETNSLAMVNFKGYNAVQPPLEEGEKLPWRGTLIVTNSAESTDTSPQSVFTNSVSFYGRGRFMGSRSTFGADKTIDLDLAEFDVGRVVDSTASGVYADLNFYNTKFGAFNGNVGATSADWSAGSAYFNLYGSTVIDLINLTDPGQTARHADVTGQMRFKPRSSLTVQGVGGTYVSAIDEMPTRFQSYEIGEGVTETRKTSDDGTSGTISAALRTRDFKMGANATHTNLQWNMAIEALGEVLIDPTASIVQTPYNASNNGCWPAFTSLAETPPTANLSLKTMPSGYSLRWIAGSAFYANGVDITSGFTGSYGYWLDTGSDCYFSNTSNWGRATLYKTGTYNMSLSAKNHAVMTNDVDDVAVKSLMMSVEHDGYSASAPMVVCGKPIRVTSTSIPTNIIGGALKPMPAVSTKSAFPQTFAARIDSAESVLCAATYNGDWRGALYFKGGIHAPNARFVPSGSIVLGGTVNVADFNPTNCFAGYRTRRQSPYGLRYWTEVMLKPGCEMTVSGQTSANAADVELAIMTNASMTVNGPWAWNETNTEHLVNGLLHLNGTVGGNAVQGYFGTGTLKVKTTDGANGGKLRIGEGLTLEPAAADWGSMPIEITDDATILNNLGSWTYEVAAGIPISRPGHSVTFDGTGATTVAGPISGYDIRVVKKGTGTLVLADGNELTNSTVEVASGTLKVTADQSLGALRVAPGATLSFGSNGASLASVAVSDDVDLSGVGLKVANGAVEGWTRVLSVPSGASITGEPVVNGLSVRLVAGAQGGSDLQVMKIRGTRVFFR